MINFESLNMEATKKIGNKRNLFNSVKTLIFIFLIIAFLGCQKKDERPRDVLDKQQLASVMIDLYLAEARLSSYPIQRDSSLALFLPRENAILAKRNLPDSTLKKTYDYYLQHPDDFNEVYDILIDSLTVLEKVKGDESTKK
jgi:hypothetical protein